MVFKCPVCPMLFVPARRRRTYCCLQEALDSNSQGIWAGTTDRQRNGMKRRAAAA